MRREPQGAAACAISAARVALLALSALGCDRPSPTASASMPAASASMPAASASTPAASAPTSIAPPLDGSTKIEAAVAIVSHDPSCFPAAPALVCAGTLIAPDIVLTAAHCLDKNIPTSLDVIAASDGESARVRVRAGAKHPGFERATFTHDIAVLVLARSLTIAPIPLRRAPRGAAGATLDVVGYSGAPGGPPGLVRQSRGLVRLDAIEDRRLKLLPLTSMTCRGDSGGPVLARNGDRLELAGVTTHGDPACREVGFAARVDRYLDFIDAQIAAARAPEPPRRPFDPNEDLCRAPCARDADCPLGLTCFAAEQRCSFEGLPPARFGASCGASCDNDNACVRVGESACRCLNPCLAEEPQAPGGAPSPAR